MTVEPTEILHSGVVVDLPTRTPTASRPAPRLLARLRGLPHLATYSGLALILLGGVLLVVAWGRVAGETAVGLQMPYVISAGCTGLAFVGLGIALVSHASKAADARLRAAQLAELRDVLTAIATTVEALGDRAAEDRSAVASRPRAKRAAPGRSR